MKSSAPDKARLMRWNTTKDLVKVPLKSVARQLKRELVRQEIHTRPWFIVIGAQKAGTTALFSILDQHPQIVAPADKEIDFFDGLKIAYGDFVAYHTKFPLPYRLGKGRITFEATPNYLCRPECPQRIHDYAPDMRLVTLLRDPVVRAYSAWNMYHGFAHSSNADFQRVAESRTFPEVIAAGIREIEQDGPLANPCSYISRGLYAEQLKRYFQYFDRDAMLILDYDDLVNAPQTCLATLCRFLQIDDTFRFDVEYRNVSRYESSIPRETADRLGAFYAPHNQNLFQLLGIEFEW